ncbi:hypothetical protein [Xenorhabdus nematophila]|uniref:hypothetical protein n=1 Tax=Xenorhabdus nematophila TaxID=628 RepID=UPI000540D476|nr:hypothetical protein XNA1_2470012 [Xenorhabdus nematophila str. Anatoliense]CEK24002.1 protein of unknown function [Xenorhabdus nematophila AN6/1]
MENGEVIHSPFCLDLWLIEHFKSIQIKLCRKCLTDLTEYGLMRLVSPDSSVGRAGD